MKYIKKPITSGPHYVPLNIHVVKSYTVDAIDGVIVANIHSYYDVEALKHEDHQPLNHTSIVIEGTDSKNVIDYIYQSLVKERPEVPNQYEYSNVYGIADRNTYAGGTIESFK